MPINTRIIKTDGTEVPIKPENGRHFELKEIQTHVGGYIELVRTKDEGKDCLMVCDEDGIAKRLPQNPKATQFYLKAGGDTPIFGNVVICGLRQIH